MSHILLFDDAEDYRSEIIQELSSRITGKVISFDNESGPEEGVTYEQHIERQLSDATDGARIGLIACDKELGMYRHFPGLSANAISVVARNLGIPFCQYSRHPKANRREIERFNTLKRWDSEEITLTGHGAKEWAAEIAELWRGFEFIRAGYLASDIKKMKPAAALAAVMGRPDATSRISLYGSGDQSILTEVFAFVEQDSHEEFVHRMPRVLGTWLRLSILRFPGLLVDEIAAASHLNVAKRDFAEPKVQAYFADACYSGPFSGLGKWWWRDALECLMLDAQADDGRDYLNKKGVKVEPCLDEDML